MKWKNRGHEFDELVDKLIKKNRLFLYGIGGNAKELIKVLTRLEWAISWEIILVDKDIEKQKSGFKEYNIISPDVFINQVSRDDIICVCPGGEIGKEIWGICCQLKVDTQCIFVGSNFLYNILPVFVTYTTDKVFFSSINMLPSTVCNLHCRDCLNFTPYIKTHRINSIKVLKRNVDLFFGAVDYIYRFQITGGEPLLYNDLEELINYIDSNYRDKIFELEMVTNGTIIPSEKICRVLQEKKIKVFLDDYRMSVVEGDRLYQTVKKMFTAFQVEYVDNHVDEWIRMYTGIKYDRSVFDCIELFQQCSNPWSTLWDGKISSCNYAAYAATAKICESDEREYFDLELFTQSQKRELIEFRVGFSEKGYTHFCELCNGWTSINPYRCVPAIQEKGDR